MSLPNGSSANSSSAQSAMMPRSASFNSSQILAQRKLFAESQMGRSSFQKLLEPRVSQIPGISPYRIVLGNVKDKVFIIHLDKASYFLAKFHFYVINASILLCLCPMVQLMKTQRRLELLLEDLPCEYDSCDYYETSDQILEPLLLCYDSLVISL